LDLPQKFFCISLRRKAGLGCLSKKKIKHGGGSGPARRQGLSHEGRPNPAAKNFFFIVWLVEARVSRTE
jgi:hypothetical protein